MDLILQIQSNKRLEFFIGKFKLVDTRDPHSKAAKKQQDPVMKSYLDAMLSDGMGQNLTTPQSRSERRLRGRILKELDEMFVLSDFFNSEQLTEIMLDLGEYKYDTILVLSLHILNKYFSSRTHTFELAEHSQILITAESNKVYTQVQKKISMLGFVGIAKPTEEQAAIVCEVLQLFRSFCHLRYDNSQPHRINQDILLNFGILDLLFQILEQFFDASLIEQYSNMQTILRSALQLLASLSHRHQAVQMRVFEHVDAMLRLKYVEAEVALALREAFSNNLELCLKVTPKQIDEMVHILGQRQTAALEIFDLLKELAKLDEHDLPLKRNQQVIMDALMEDFNKVAAVFNIPKEERLGMICHASEDDLNLIYLMKLVDLLATCAEGENRHIESLCQTILPLDELLRILNQSIVPPRLKRCFTNYLVWVYMRTAGTMVESGASELPHDRDVWAFIETLGDEMNRLTVFVSQNGDSIREFLKPWSSARGLTEERKIEVGRQLKDAEFFATTGAVFLQTFILKFYSPETEAFPEEGVIIDNVAKAAMVINFQQNKQNKIKS